MTGTSGSSLGWDPAQYAVFADHRGRPFGDLLARVGAPSPRLVADLGCGNGPLTLSLAQRWPQARVVGLDSSSEMLAAARSLDAGGRVEWVRGDLTRVGPEVLGAAPDVVVTNAALQWVPEHLSVIRRWTAALPPGGWLALQVPGNLDSPAHRLMRECVERHPAAERLRPAVSRMQVASPPEYVELLASAGLVPDVWETTYQHVLDAAGAQESPVLEWVRGTGLRPVLEALADEGERAAFLADYDALLRAAYPRMPFGVVLPFRRIFAVGHRM
jgi:trans-aconitate 2-methyltransferase